MCSASLRLACFGVHGIFKKLSLARMLRVVLVLCAGAAITSPAQVLTTLVSFDGTNGANPWAPVIEGADGNFYGTTFCGGTQQGGCGTVFRVTPSGTLTTLYEFCSQSQCADGAEPAAPLVQASDGNFYGTTSAGGNRSGNCLAIGCGTVFRITPNGTLTTLHAFSGGDGSYPYTGLLQARDGNLYGTTSDGAFFKVTLNGTFTYISGGIAASPLVQGTDGNFYGTTTRGGLSNCGNGCGTVFRVSPRGTFTRLYEFCSQQDCADGYAPVAGLVQASDGNFYGTTTYGGSGGYHNLADYAGTIFRITPSGTLTTLYSFCSQPNCSDGDRPYGTLVQASDGNLYGTTQNGGSGAGTYGAGTIFKITPSDAFTTLYNFCSPSPCNDGSTPYAGLVQANNGIFYGTTTFGVTGGGTVFSLQTNSSLLTVSTSGNGTVTSTDGFIDCPGTCSHVYPNNTQVTLNANPTAGWAFSGWNGACSGTGPCVVTMTQGLSVGAAFTVTYTLTVSTSGNGTVTSTDGFINCPSTCSHTYLSDTQVTLNANPALGWSLSAWGGACSGNGSCSFPMTQNESVTATFTQDYYTLTVEIFGNGSVTSTDGYINCPGMCSHTYLSLTHITLNAAAAEGWMFRRLEWRLHRHQFLYRDDDAILNDRRHFFPSPAIRCGDRPAGWWTRGRSTVAAVRFRVAPLETSPSQAGRGLQHSHLGRGLFAECHRGSAGAAGIPHHLADRRRSAVRFYPELGGWPGEGQRRHRARGSQGAVSVFVSNTTDVVLDIDGYFAPQQLDAGVLSADAVPGGRHPQQHLSSGPGTAVLDGRSCARFSDPEQHNLQYSQHAQAYSLNFTVVPAWAAGLSDGVAGRPAAAQRFHPERGDRHGRGQRGDRAGGQGGWRHRRVCQQRYGPGDRYQRLLRRAGQGGLSLYPVAPCRVLDTRLVGNGQPFAGTERRWMWWTARVRRRAAAQAYVFNATVVPSVPLGYLTLWPRRPFRAAGLNAERDRRSGHVEHGDRAHEQRED